MLINKFINHLRNEEFDAINNRSVIERIKWASFMLIFTYPLFFIIDLFLLNDINGSTFHTVLSVIHGTGLIISVVYLILMKTQLVSEYLIYIYVSSYLLLGASASINSQLLTGNIMAYIIAVFGVATMLPINPKRFIPIIVTIHLLFLTGLSLLLNNGILMNVINSSGAVVIAILVSYAIYTYRNKDFQSQKKLKETEESFRRLFNMNPSPLILYNIQSDQVVLINKQAMNYFQIEDISKFDGKLIFTNKEVKNELLQQIMEEQKVEDYVVRHEVTHMIKRWSMIKAEKVKYLDHQCLLLGITDITNLRRAASIDPLTGVMNRKAGLEMLEMKLAGFDDFIISFIDINNLKQVNDQFGHASGDELIKIVAKVISSKLDKTDQLFRYGGDEFIVVFSTNSLEKVQTIWRNVLLEFKAINSNNEKFKVGIAYGLYQYHSNSNASLEEIIDRADKEMYLNKSEYKKIVT